MKKILLLFSTISILSCTSSTKKNQDNSTDSTGKYTQLPPPVRDSIPGRDELLKKIKDREKELFASDTLDKNKAKEMIRLYERYYQNYYKYPECPDFLFKAGEIAENIGQYNRAAKFYKDCCTNYGGYTLRPECLFRLANVYDFKLNDYIQAKEIYKQVIEQYPKNPLANDAAAAIKLMGRSDMEMVRSFEKKNKK